MNISGIFNKSNFNAFFKTARETNLSTLMHRSASIIKDALLYPRWFRKQIPSQETLDRQRNHIFEYTPCISIVVPTYCTPIPFLREMIQSVRSQTYTNWELCIADASPSDSEIRTMLLEYKKKDRRIKIKFLESNQGISGNTNHALSLATGDYIGLLDHDDMLAPNALYEIASAVNQDTTIDVLYTDEDKVDGNGVTHYYPNFKPDYNPYLLRSCNYICHFFVFHKSILNAIGFFKAEFDGSQDFNYILRATSVAKNIYHIPKMLYHWRVHSGSVASDPSQKMYCYEAARNAIQQNLDALKVPATVTYSRLTGFYNTEYCYNEFKGITVFTPITNLTITEQENYPITVYTTDTIHPEYIEENICQSDNTFYVFLGEEISTISASAIIKMISYFGDSKVGAVTPKIIHKGKTSSLGIYYQNNCFKGCYENIPANDAGYYGRNLLDQNIPICFPSAFVCRQSLLAAFFKETDNNVFLTHENLAVLLSLYISTRHQYVVGAANIHVHISRKTSLPHLKDFANINHDALAQISYLYSIPPYYH